MKVLAFFLTFVLALSLPVAATQRTAPVDKPEVQKPVTPDDTHTATGEISKLDTTTKMFSLKATTATERDKVFYYDDKTTFSGIENGAKGLKVGSTVKVTYTDKQGKSWATKIESATRKS
jgi:hypothetical protein